MAKKNIEYEKLFREQSVWRAIFSMAIPALLTILVTIFYNMADLFFIAQLGDTAKVAAVSVITPVFSIIMALSTMIGAGGSALIAAAFGKGDMKKAADTSSVCFYGAIAIGAVVTVLLLLFPDLLLRILGATTEMWRDARSYLIILSSGTVFMLTASSMGLMVRAEGAVREGLIGNLAGTVTNIVLDPLFILAFGWGTAGAAAATVIGNMVSSGYYVVYIRRHSPVISLDPKRALANPLGFLPAAALGLPNAASTTLAGFASAFSNQILSGYGTDAIAARAAAGKTSMLISMVQMGICMGVQPLLAYNYGSGSRARLKEVLIKLAILTGAIGAATTAFCFLFRHSLVALFLKEAGAAAIGERFILYLMAGAPFLGLVYISTNYLQAVGSARSALAVSLLRQGVLLIPLLHLFNAAFGLTGVAAANMTADIGAAAIAMILFFVRYRKENHE